MSRPTPFVLPSVALLATLSLLASARVGRSAEPPQRARHQAMERVGGAMKPLAPMAKGDTPFDAVVVERQAAIISENLAQAATLFPPGSDTGETHAKPEVWSDRAGFDQAMKEGRDAAAALQKVKDAAAFKAALGGLGRSCKACHDKYRMPVH